MRYLLVIENVGGNYSAYFPDVPGCTTAGKTVEKTLANAQDALSSHFCDGEPLPQGRTLQAILADPESYPLNGTEILAWITYEQSKRLATA